MNTKKCASMSAIALAVIALSLTATPVAFASSYNTYMNNGGSSPACSVWNGCIISDTGTTWMTGTYTINGGISKVGIFGSSSTDTYSRYLSVECETSSGTWYSLLSDAVVTLSFSYSWQPDLYNCVITSGDSNTVTLQFQLTTYTGFWSISMPLTWDN